MIIDRKVEQFGDVREKIRYCLDLLEEDGFNPHVNWNTLVTDRLTMEELVSALVHCEKTLDKLAEEEDDDDDDFAA